VPSSFTFALKGPERTRAPFSTVPLISTTRELTVSPSWCEEILKEGGVVSAGALSRAAVGAGAASSTSSAESSASVASLWEASSLDAVSLVVVSLGASSVMAAAVVDVSVPSGSSLWVVPVLAPESATRIARIAEATRADIGVDEEMLSATTVVGAASDDPIEGENAAKPTTATRAIMSKLA
jgi:hypothetical protein